MHDINPKLTVRDVLGYVIAYVFWLLAASIALGAILMMRAALNAFWPAVGLSRWALRPVDRFGLIVLAIVWLIFVIVCEHHLRSSITEARHRRMSRAIRVTPQAENESKTMFMMALTRLGLDLLARRLVLALAIPLAVLGLAYLAYWASWKLMAP